MGTFLFSRSCLLFVPFIFLYAPQALGGPASFQWLGDLPGGSYYGGAMGVSNNGSVVVGYVNSPDDQAFKWTSSTGMTALDGTAATGRACGVSANGSVIVGWRTWGSSLAVIFQDGGAIMELGDLPGGTYFSQAFAVSHDGTAVVGWSAPGRVNRPSGGPAKQA